MISYVMPHSIHPPLCPHGKTRQPLDGLSLHLMLKNFSETCRENM